MEIVVKSRHTAVSDRFRTLAAEKLSKVERLDAKVFRIDVEVSREHNPRQSHACDRVELTCLSRGPVIRAEAAADSPFAALDLAYAKLEGRLRRVADRRRVHHGSRTPPSLAGLTRDDDEPPTPDAASVGGEAGSNGSQPGRVVREKLHEAEPTTLDQALFQMELLGHDFFLFADRDSGLPSVVYRRHGYDYGVIRLRH
ncbi:MAG: ribosome-associated translation inhibitor RaiA [Actinomycetota bacterium]|nr:ribosome-associated translation inhibitor RaiA [Actinomycetota bacterium]